jgi:hypothetical protein
MPEEAAKGLHPGGMQASNPSLRRLLAVGWHKAGMEFLYDGRLPEWENRKTSAKTDPE